MSSILSRTNYLDKTIPFLVNTKITEYDMKDAGFSLIKENGLLDKKTVSFIETLDKKSKNIFIGKLVGKNKELAEVFTECFTDKRMEFIEINGLTEDNILSIKKDALFIIGKTCSNLQIGEVEFSPKNIYSSYFYINNKEFYLNGNGLTIKGLSKSTISFQRDYFINDLKILMKSMEQETQTRYIAKLRRYRNQYLDKQLDVETYREMNESNLFRIKDGLLNHVVGLESADNLNNIDIGFNYNFYLRTLIDYSL